MVDYDYGTVTQTHLEKGFFFISLDHKIPLLKNKDVFAHVRGLKCEKEKIVTGARITCKVKPDVKGFIAYDIETIGG